MNATMVVAGKEIRQAVSTKSTVIVSVFFAIWFGGMSAPAIVADAGQTLDAGIFYLGLVLGVFAVYILSGQVFLREKQEGIIETLLCTPLTLREIWLGKVIGVTVPAYAIALLGVGVLLAIVNAGSETLLLPSLPVIVHLVVAVPLIMASAVGLMGFIQFLFGLRENQIINLVIFAGLFFLLFVMQSVLSIGVEVSWLQVGFFIAAGVLLLAATNYLAGFLSREKIVRTIP